MARALLLCVTSSLLPIARAQAWPKVEQFTAPDGSRFVLASDSSAVAVQWATASWIDGSDDPPGFPGLALTTLRASLNGTWATGSRDAEAERRALAELDEAWREQLQHVGDAAAYQRVIAATQAAQALCDLNEFRRVLAALPAEQPEVVARGPIGVFVLTTLESALPAVARIVTERREQQALRDLPRLWMEHLVERMQQHAGDPTLALKQETLALIDPTSPALRLLERPTPGSPSRGAAHATWAASQHPTRTVHLLLGKFDLVATKTLLQSAFASTSLPTPPQVTLEPLPSLRSERHSIVHGLATPRVIMSWALPPITEPGLLHVAIDWFANMEGSHLRRALDAAGLRDVTVRGHAPWPSGQPKHGMLFLELAGGDDAQKMIAAVRGACATALDDRPDGHYWPANRLRLRGWTEDTTNARQLALRLAAQALAWPDEPIRLNPLGNVPGAAIRDLLRRTFAGQPILVEGQP